MGAVFDHIKGYGEQQVIDAMRQRWDQARGAQDRISWWKGSSHLISVRIASLGSQSGLLGSGV
jgi:hypothetical protein